MTESPASPPRSCDFVAFANGESLIGFHIEETLNLLSRGPFHFNQIHLAQLGTIYSSWGSDKVRAAAKMIAV